MHPNTTDRSQFTLALTIFSAFLNPMRARIAFGELQYSQESMWHDAPALAQSRKSLGKMNNCQAGDGLGQPLNNITSEQWR
jgi:hypothetical protein